jgi:2-dehydro-3-deoxygluconokinase
MVRDRATGSAFDVVCFGESMVLFVPQGGSLESAAAFAVAEAGAESNVAIGLARLGDSVAWASRVGADVFGRRLTAAVGAQGVDVGLVDEDVTRRTGLIFKEPSGANRAVTYYRAGSAASAMDEADGARAVAAARRVIHLSGITPALSPTCDRAVESAFERARAAGVLVSFDINFRKALWPDLATAAARLGELGRRADVTFVGLDEAEVVWGCDSADAVRAVLDGPVLVVKDAPRRVTVFSAEGRVDVELPPVDVVESVGAGDAFAAGYLHGVLAGWPTDARVRAGHVLAASVLGSAHEQAVDFSAAALERAVDPAAWSTGKVMG